MSASPIAYKVRQAAELVGISKFLLYDAIKAGQLPVTRAHPRGDMLILADDLHGWLARNRTTGAATS